MSMSPANPGALFNCQIEVEEDQLVIVVDLKAKPGETKQGNIKLASTHGNQLWATPVGPVQIGLNIFQYPNQRKLEGVDRG